MRRGFEQIKLEGGGPTRTAVVARHLNFLGTPKPRVKLARSVLLYHCTSS